VLIGLGSPPEVAIALDRFIENPITRQEPEFARRFDDLHPESGLDQRGERGRHGSAAHHAGPQCHGRRGHRGR
jgi:hypothetical protein